MFFRPHKNRRRIDPAKKAVALFAAVGAIAARVFAGVLLSFALAAAAWGGWRWASTSDQFGLKSLIIEGAARAAEAELARLGGLSDGVNLVAMDTEAVERALSAHPWVASVSVRRELPSRLVVHVQEHRAVAVLALGDLYLVDERGVPFKRRTAADELDLPLITGVDRDDFLGDRERALGRLQRAVDVITAYQGRNPKRKDLSEVHVQLDEATVVTTRGEIVRLGAGALAEKLDRLERVRGELEARSLEAGTIRLDNRARPDWVAVQLAPAPAERGGQR
jgi:cell division protein FtsQ